MPQKRVLVVVNGVRAGFLEVPHGDYSSLEANLRGALKRPSPSRRVIFSEKFWFAEDHEEEEHCLAFFWKRLDSPPLEI